MINYFFIVVGPIAIQAALYIALAEAVRRISGVKGTGLLGFNPRWMVIGESLALPGCRRATSRPCLRDPRTKP